MGVDWYFEERSDRKVRERQETIHYLEEENEFMESLLNVEQRRRLRRWREARQAKEEE